MYMRNFDTHKYVEAFQESGFDKRQAEMLVRSLLEARDSDLSNLATREQVNKLEMNFEKKFSALDKKIDHDTNATREQISTLDRKIDQVENKLDKKIDQVENKLDEKITTLDRKIDTVKSDLITEMTKNKYDTVKWMVGLFVTLVITILVRPYIH
jgi:hypothetical protein